MAVTSFANLELVSLWNTPVRIDPTTVTELEPLPSPQRYLGIEGTRIKAGGTDFFVQGSPPIVKGMLQQAIQQTGGQFTPVLTLIAGAVGSVQGVATWWRNGNEVVMTFQLNYNPNAAGANELIKFTLPFVPATAPFTNANQLTGVAEISGSTAAAFVQLGPSADVGSSLGAVTVNMTDVDTLVGITVRYTAAAL